MLSMLLLLAAAPQAAEAPAQSLRPATTQEMIDAGVIPPPPPPGREALMRVLGDAGVGCGSDVRRADDPRAGNGLMWRGGGEPVGLYRLLDRRVNDCPAPIIVNYRVPGSNAIGREAGRSDEAAPVIVRRP